MQFSHNIFSSFDLRANLCSKSLNLLRGCKEFLSVINSPVPDLGEIRSKRSTHNNVDHFRFNENRHMEGRNFLTSVSKI